MPIKIVKYYTREMAQSMPDALFVFGDNLVRKGYGGQAAALRDEPNAVGIPTKRSPSQYLNDNDVEAKYAIDDAFDQLNEHLAKGGLVVWPADGVGTGLARLEEKAPKIWQYLQSKVVELLENNDD